MDLEQIASLAQRRAVVMAELETLSVELRDSVVTAIRSGQLSELKAHKITGVSRSAIRQWLGKDQ